MAFNNNLMHSHIYGDSERAIRVEWDWRIAESICRNCCECHFELRHSFHRQLHLPSPNATQLLNWILSLFSLHLKPPMSPPLVVAVLCCLTLAVVVDNFVSFHSLCVCMCMHYDTIVKHLANTKLEEIISDNYKSSSSSSVRCTSICLPTLPSPAACTLHMRKHFPQSKLALRATFVLLHFPACLLTLSPTQPPLLYAKSRGKCTHHTCEREAICHCTQIECANESSGWGLARSFELFLTSNACESSSLCAAALFSN